MKQVQSHPKNILKYIGDFKYHPQRSYKCDVGLHWPRILRCWAEWRRPAAGWWLRPQTGPGTWRAAGTRWYWWERRWWSRPSRTSPPFSSSAPEGEGISTTGPDHRRTNTSEYFLFHRILIVWLKKNSFVPLPISWNEGQKVFFLQNYVQMPFLKTFIIIQAGKTHLLRLPPTLQNKYICVNVFDTDPTGQRQSGVRPNPVHHCPELRQEGHQTKSGTRTQVKCGRDGSAVYCVCV